MTTTELCADCGAPVRLRDDWPIDGIVIRGNPSEVICLRCAAKLGVFLEQPKDEKEARP